MVIHLVLKEEDNLISVDLEILMIFFLISLMVQEEEEVVVNISKEEDKINLNSISVEVVVEEEELVLEDLEMILIKEGLVDSDNNNKVVNKIKMLLRALKLH